MELVLNFYTTYLEFKINYLGVTHSEERERAVFFFFCYSMAITHTHFVHYIKCGPGPTCYGARVHWKFMVVFDRQNVSLDEKQSFIKPAYGYWRFW